MVKLYPFVDLTATLKVLLFLPHPQLLIINQTVFSLPQAGYEKLVRSWQSMQQEQKERMQDTDLCSAGGTSVVCSVCVCMAMRDLGSLFSIEIVALLEVQRNLVWKDPLERIGSGLLLKTDQI